MLKSPPFFFENGVPASASIDVYGFLLKISPPFLSHDPNHRPGFLVSVFAKNKWIAE
jgi:hypothetical protein